jgi:uncharacterized protein with LGFP repeats
MCTADSLYDNPTVAPLWSYPHGSQSPDGSNVTGGVFADSTTYPAKYRDAYFFGDTERELMWALTTDNHDQLVAPPVAPDPSVPFGSSIGGPVEFRVGPDGDIYVADINTGTIWHLGYTPFPPIAAHWLELGGPFSFLGLPVGPEQDVPGGRMQPFAGGAIYWSAATGAHEVHGSIRIRYEQLGGPSTFGFPTTDETPTFLGFGEFNEFERGSIYWMPATGAHEVHGAIRDAWSSLGSEFGFLGFPVTDETPTFLGFGRFNDFQGGSVYWLPATGAHEVHGAIRDKWSSLGAEAGFLGFPTTNETPAADGGRVNGFQGGSVYWSPATGAHEVHGAIRDAYDFLGGPSSSLGYPVTDELSYLGVRINVFEHGTIDWTPQGGAQPHS